MVTSATSITVILFGICRTLQIETDVGRMLYRELGNGYRDHSHSSCVQHVDSISEPSERLRVLRKRYTSIPACDTL
jgi:hypothetical protein